MGFLLKVLSAGAKLALTPVAITVDVIRGDLGAEGTGNLLSQVVDDLDDAVDNLNDGDVI